MERARRLPGTARMRSGVVIDTMIAGAEDLTLRPGSGGMPSCRKGRPSRTAERVAMRRAAHQLYDDPPLVFADPLAVRILPEEARVELREREEMERTHPFARGMRAFMCARSRFAEDALERAVRRGRSAVRGARRGTRYICGAFPACRSAHF